MERSQVSNFDDKSKSLKETEISLIPKTVNK